MPKELSYRRIVREIALDNHGYVTTRDAQEHGVPPIELPKLAARGGLDNIAYGLYRVSDIPVTPLDQYAEALARVGDHAYLHGESVLALHELADVNPQRITVATTRRTRAQHPPYLDVVRVAPGARVTHYEGLATQPVADALRECRGRVETSRLHAAAEQAREHGLVAAAEWQHLREDLLE